jgi:hypothetical protein
LAQKHCETAGQLTEIDERHGMDGPKVVPNPAAIPKGQAGVSGLERFDPRADGSAIRDHEA